jgi:hypothetical protein
VHSHHGRKRLRSSRHGLLESWPHPAHYLSLSTLPLAFCSTMIAVIQGTIGIIMSLETYHSVSKGNRWFLKWYALYNILNTIVSIVVAGVVLGGLDVECSQAPNRDACNDIGVLYGVLLSLGASSVGVFAAINSTLAYLSMTEAAPTGADRKVDL